MTHHDVNPRPRVLEGIHRVVACSPRGPLLTNRPRGGTLPRMDKPSNIYVPPGGPPQDIAPSREIYAVMGEENIFRMCRDFYARIGSSSIRHLFPEDLPAASEKIAAFLVGLLGGPPLYAQRYGSPMMRARHLPFAIDEAARQEWLRCFREVLADAPEAYGFPPEHLPGFHRFLDGFSAWMVNRRSA